MLRCINIVVLLIVFFSPCHGFSDLLFSESFEDTSLTDRSWYDGSSVVITSGGGYSGNCLQWTWASSASYPTGTSSAWRHLFTATDELFIRMYMKTDSNWQGQQVSYGGPHLFYVLTDIDDAYSGLASTALTSYIELDSDVGSPYATYPQFIIQDSDLINTSYGTPPIDLVSTTEDRSVAGCNGDLGSTGDVVSCYYSDTQYLNGRHWSTTTAITKNTWFRLDTYLKMNSISNGIAQADGIIRQWLDGEQVQNITNAVFRTGNQATKEWNQFIMGPYMGSSPISQTVWVDELSIYDENIVSDSVSSTCSGSFTLH